jgi:hypothetical protein
MARTTLIDSDVRLFAPLMLEENELFPSSNVRRPRDPSDRSQQVSEVLREVRRDFRPDEHQEHQHEPGDRSHQKPPGSAAKPFPVGVGAVLVTCQTNKNYLGKQLRYQYPRYSEDDCEQDALRRRMEAKEQLLDLAVIDVEKEVDANRYEGAEHQPGCRPQREIAYPGCFGPRRQPAKGIDNGAPNGPHRGEGGNWQGPP